MTEIKEVSVNGENVAVIVCPKCNKSKSVDMSKYMTIDNVIKFKAKCRCGYSYTILLNKRDNLRKKTKLFGNYTHLSPGKKGQKGHMSVLDVSRSGLKTEILQLRFKMRDHDISVTTAEKGNFEPEIVTPADELNVGDHLLMEFRLDNAKRSLIRKEVTIKWVDIPYIGVEFSSESLFDADLGYYVMSKE